MTSPFRASDAAGIVLCGGRSTRMGTPKALLPFGSETMLQRVVRRLGGAVSPIVVVAAADQTLPALPDEVIVARDGRPDRGPLEGLRTGWQALPPAVERAYVTSCDVPLLVPGFVRQLLNLAGAHDAAVVEAGGFLHPLAAVYTRRTLAVVERFLADGQLRLASILEAVDTRRVRPDEMTADPELRTLRNVNTPDDYAQALAEARRIDGLCSGSAADD